MSHYPHGLGDSTGSQQDVYVAAAMEAKANLYREAKAQKKAEANKKRKSQNNLPAVQTQASQQSLQRTHSPRASMNSMTQQQLAMQQGSLVMMTQLHTGRLRGQYFSVYEQKAWYCDLAGTNIGCAANMTKGEFKLHDIAYWRCEMCTRQLCKCGVTFCNACVIRDEQMSRSPMAGAGPNGGMMFPPQHMQSASMGSMSGMSVGMGGASLGGQSNMGNQSYINRNQGGGASASSTGSNNLTPQELAAMQQANANNGKKNSKLGKVYTEPGIVKKGWMLKRGTIVKSWKRRYFVLKEDRHLYFYSNDQTSTVKGVAQFFDVEKIVKHDKQIFSVELKGGRTYHYSCPSESDRDDWCAKLKLLCKAQVMLASTGKKGKPAPEDDQKE